MHFFCSRSEQPEGDHDLRRRLLTDHRAQLRLQWQRHALDLDRNCPQRLQVWLQTRALIVCVTGGAAH